jgi:Putative MetA-pathway of phenol degradation
LRETELRFTAPNYYHNLPSGSGASSGFGDIAIGVKQQLGPIGGFDLSVIPSLSLPTGARSVSSGGYDPAVQLPWSRSLSANWTAAGQLASYWPTDNGRRNFTAEATLLVDRQLSAPCDVFIEYAGDFPQRGGSSQLLHIGTGYKLAARHQIDLHAAAGLSHAAPRSFIGVGYSFLLLGDSSVGR